MSYSQAYNRTIRDTEGPRDIERRLLNRVTGRLKEFQEEYDGASNPTSVLTEEYRTALWDNQRVWITLKSDLRSEGNAFPPQLKADLISIAEWVNNHTDAVFAGTAKVQPLIDINTNIINGLRK